MKRNAMIGYTLAAALCAGPAMAQELTGTLKNIKQTGAITLGFRDSSIPFSYLDDNQKPIGYAMDICYKIVDAVKKELKLDKLEVKLNPVTSSTRIPLLANGTIDLGAVSGVTVSGDGTGTVTISGSAAAINAALDGLIFNPTADYNGGAWMTVSTSDGSATVNNTIALSVTAVFDIEADTIGTNEDQARTVNVVTNDTCENSGAASPTASSSKNSSCSPTPRLP